MVICANSVQLSHLHLQLKMISKHLLFIPPLDVQEMKGRGHLYGVRGLYIKSALSEWLWMCLDLKKVGEQWCIQSSCSVWFSRASVLSPGLRLIASHVVRAYFVFAVKEESGSVILLFLTLLSDFLNLNILRSCSWCEDILILIFLLQIHHHWPVEQWKWWVYKISKRCLIFITCS